MKKHNKSFFHIFIVLTLVAVNAFSLPLGFSLGVDAFVFFLFGAPGFTGVDKKTRSLLMSVFLLTLYTLLICFLNFEFSSYTIGKPMRMLAFYSIFALIAKKLTLYKNEEIAIGVLLALLLHLACVYCQFFIPSSKPLFFSFLRADMEFDNIEDPLRAFGLDASFDGAGLNICVLLVLLWLFFKQTKDIKFYILGILSLLGCFMVGRTAMLVGSLVFIAMLLSLFKNNKVYFLLSIVLFAIGVYLVWDLFMFYLDNFDVQQSYRKESVTHLTTNSMLFLPDTFWGSLFGTGNLPANSDIGYIKIIHMIGFAGLFFVLMLYKTTITSIKPFKRIDKDVYLFMVLFLILLLAYNYKLLLLYSRGINDVYFLLIFIILRKQCVIQYANN